VKADTGGQYALIHITAPPGLQAPLHVEHAYGPRDAPHRFTIGPDGARMLWVLTPGGFEDMVIEASVPAETPTVPPAGVLPPENVVEVLRRHGNELLPG
jgi:hypothetical protein